MRIGILETGAPPAALQPAHGRYDAMFRRLLGAGHAYTVYRAHHGELPASPDEQDAWLITGSPAGVNDGTPWIEALARFVRTAFGRRPLVGICFGHQLMAHALGGKAERAAQGWGIGLHRYSVTGDAAWLDDAVEVAVPASHQDQVTVAPPGTQVIARSAFTPYAALAYPRDAAISFQFHPEFDAGYARDLLAAMPATAIGESERRAALASLDAPADNGRIAGWIERYLNR